MIYRKKIETNRHPTNKTAMINTAMVVPRAHNLLTQLSIVAIKIFDDKTCLALLASGPGT